MGEKGNGPFPITGKTRPEGRSLCEFRLPDLGTPSGLYPAEERLLDTSRTGRLLSFAEARPAAPAEHNHIRGSLIRFLALGGDNEAPVHEKGVQLQGAFIKESIDLDYAECLRPLRLIQCNIDGWLHGRNARLVDLNLQGSRCIGAAFDDARFAGSVTLRDGFTCEGGLRFTGAVIQGDLDLSGASIRNSKGDALACRRIRVTRTVFLSDGFSAEGRVRFSGAEIGGDFACYGGRFILHEATPITNPTEKPRAGYALSLANARIDEVLWLGPWTPPSDAQVRIEGSLNLQGARVATLADHELSWPPRGIQTAQGWLPCVISLDGFVYEVLGAGAPTDALIRKTWLMQQQPRRGKGIFRPQPFEQLIKVLRNMGYDQDATRIGLLKESLLEPIRVRRASFWSRPLVMLTGYAWGALCGYGYRPHRLFVLLMGLWMAAAWFFHFVEQKGAFAPRDPQVWTNNEIVAECARTRWTLCPRVADLIPFNAVTYAVDTIIPVIDLGQRSGWAPTLKPLQVDLPYAGARILPAGTVHVVSWLVSIIGAVSVITLGAILSGFVRRG